MRFTVLTTTILMSLLFIFALPCQAMPHRDEWRAATQGSLQEAPDILGREFPGAKTATIVVFFKPGCPLANYYSSRLATLAKTYRDAGIVFVGIAVTGETSRLESVKSWVESRKLPFKVLHDTGALRRHFQAAVSPEVFIMDQDFEMVYRGKIDDQFQPGRPNLREPAHNYLGDRLAKIAQGDRLVPSFTLAKGCLLTSERVSFNRDIAPVIYNRCTTCHRPNDIQSQIPLTTYAEIVDWAPTIAQRIEERYMPPWRAHHAYGNFANDVSLTVNEMWQFAQWVEDDMPCDETPIEAPTTLTESKWRIGKPDAVLGMLPEGESYTVPKEGILPYQHFEITSPFDEDKWVIATEVRAGAPEVVHHINVFIVPPEKEGFLTRALKRRGAAKRLRELGQAVDHNSLGRVLDLYGYKLEKRILFLSDFNPAESVTTFPEGKGLLLKKGSRFVFEVHYTPNGYQEMEDRSLIAFKFADDVPEDWQVREPITRTAGKLGEIEIAPQSQKRLKFDLPIYLDADLHSLKPHMHFRGKSFKAELLQPNRAPVTVLYIPQWDYDFQLPYLFKRPLFMPKGSILRMTYYWDNSSTNPNISEEQANEPSAFGFQTSDEMCMAFPTYTYRSTDIEEIERAEQKVTEAILKQVKLPSSTSPID